MLCSVFEADFLAGDPPASRVGGVENATNTCEKQARNSFTSDPFGTFQVSPGGYAPWHCNLSVRLTKNFCSDYTPDVLGH